MKKNRIFFLCKMKFKNIDNIKINLEWTYWCNDELFMPLFNVFFYTFKKPSPDFKETLSIFDGSNSQFLMINQK